MTDTLRRYWIPESALEPPEFKGGVIREVYIAADVERGMVEKDELIASLQHTTSYESVMELKAALAAKDDDVAMVTRQLAALVNKLAVKDALIAQLQERVDELEHLRERESLDRL